MNPWFAKGALLAANAVLVAIRAPHGQRSRSVPVAQSRRGPLELALLAWAPISFLVPFAWVASDVFALAAFALRPLPYAAGPACYGLACGCSTARTPTSARTGRSCSRCARRTRW
jgi:hypothetical protein